MKQLINKLREKFALFLDAPIDPINLPMSISDFIFALGIVIFTFGIAFIIAFIIGSLLSTYIYDFIK